jgi:hypothetical protein
MQAIMPELPPAPPAAAAGPSSSQRKKTPSAYQLGGMPSGSVSLSGRISPLGALGSAPGNFRRAAPPLLPC